MNYETCVLHDVAEVVVVQEQVVEVYSHMTTKDLVKDRDMSTGFVGVGDEKDRAYQQAVYWREEVEANQSSRGYYFDGRALESCLGLERTTWSHH